MSKIPETLTDQQQLQLLLLLTTPAETPGQVRKQIRNYTMTLLMLDAGLRVGEVVKLRRGSLIFAGHFIDSLILPADITKGHYERTVPLTQRLKIAIQQMHTDYWLYYGINSDDFAFSAARKKQPMGTRQLERIIGTASELAFGISINPHVLRHTFASRLMRTVNIRIVQQLLGHKQLSSTQVYTHPNNQDLTDAINSIETKT